MGCLGYIFLLPWVVIGGVVSVAVRYSIKGGFRRAVGIIVCPIVGGLGFWLGWWLTFEGYLETQADGIYQVTYPVAGWLGMVVSALFIFNGDTMGCFRTLR